MPTRTVTAAVTVYGAGARQLLTAAELAARDLAGANGTVVAVALEEVNATETVDAKAAKAAADAGGAITRWGGRAVVTVEVASDAPLPPA